METIMKYFVFSHYVNAWTLKLGLAKLDKELLCIGDTDGLLKLTKDYPQPGDSLFFTEENSLKHYYGCKEQFNFYPKELTPELLDDKLAFAQELERIGERPVPYWEINDKCNCFPVYVKARHSWRDGLKLPRGYICNNLREHDYALNLIKRDFDIDWFFYQKLLQSPPSNNISTCGFFDYKQPQRNLIIVTKKLLGDGGKIGTGCVIQTVDDPEKLIERTVMILNYLSFSGPFELEFFYEEKDNSYYVLELNPRFWMQHGIFLEHFSNGLVKRYLNIDTPEDWRQNSKRVHRTITWFDSVYLFTSIVRLSLTVPFNYLIIAIRTKLAKGENCIFPDFGTSLTYVLGLIWKRLKKGIIRR
jgi:hypothetical protein